MVIVIYIYILFTNSYLVDLILQKNYHPQIKKFKIVADPANAMGAQYIDALFKKVPADLIKMNFELDVSLTNPQVAYIRKNLFVLNTGEVIDEPVPAEVQFPVPVEDICHTYVIAAFGLGTDKLTVPDVQTVS